MIQVPTVRTPGSVTCIVFQFRLLFRKIMIEVL